MDDETELAGGRNRWISIGFGTAVFVLSLLLLL